MAVTYPEGGIVGITMRQEQQKTGYGNNNNHMNNVRVKLITTRSIPKTKLSSPREVADYARSSMENLDREYAKIILLDTKNQVLGTETISIGSLNASIVHPREAVTSAVLSKSASTIFLHNHPSGLCEPSLEDREITRTLARAFSDLGIKLVDSIIIGRGCYYSFLEENPAVLAIPVSDKPQTVTTISEYGNRYGNRYRISEPIQNGNSISQMLQKMSVDTNRPTPTIEYQVVGAATPINGYLVAYHLTDNPDEVIRRVKADNLVGMNPYGDLGGGFYVSSVPQYWRARSRKKWDFASNLNMQQRQRLVDVILSDPKYRKGGGYLTDYEVDYLRRDLNNYVTTGEITFLIFTGNQPYNVTVTEEITRKAGLPSPKEPGLVEVSLRGKFIDGLKLYGSPNYKEFLNAAKLRSQPGEYEQNIINKWLNSMGYSGIFTKSGFSSNPEMVVWDRKAIVDIKKVA